MREFTAADHSMPVLTGLRGLAAIWVLLYHAWVYATPREILWDVFGHSLRLHAFFSLGWAGVQVLFVLSAFLLTLPYARANAGLGPRPRLFGYLGRRLARVFPAYYFQLAILATLSGVLAGALLFDIADLPRYLLMLFVPPPVGVGSPGEVNGVWWTLPIELSFYLVLPAIAWLATWERRWLLMAATLLCMVGWRYVALGVIDPEDKPMWAYQLPGSMDSFGLGMLAAVIHVRLGEMQGNPRAYRTCLKILLCLVPLLWVALGVWLDANYLDYWRPGPLLFLWTAMFGLGVVVVILNAARNSRALVVLLGNPILFYVGIVSYGVYLWHYPIGKWLLTTPWIANSETYVFPRLALLMLVLAVAAATVSWFLIEKKAIARVRRL